MATEKSMPTLTLGHTTGARREIGGKFYCPFHGLGDINGSCPKCNRECEEPRRYVNIVLVSKTEPRKTGGSEGSGFWDGKNGVRFIGEVISVHMTGTESEIAIERARLRALHKA